MRYIDTPTLNALNGSRSGDKFTVWAWYDGNLAWPEPLDIAACSLTWDTTRQVQTASLTINDPTGKLSPWLLEDPLGVGGTRLQITYEVGGAGTVNMGWYRVTSNLPNERWTPYIINNRGKVNPGSPIPKNKSLVFVSGGSTVQLTVSDLGVEIANNRLLAPDSPRGSSPTIMSELSRLLDGIVPVATSGTVTDRAVNKTLIYDRERINAVEDLCTRITCGYRMNGDGQFEVYPVTKQTPVWTIQGGPEGVLVEVDRSQTIDRLYNVFVADGTATSNGQQVPIRGITRIEGGPMRAGGPHGTNPVFYSSTMLTTQAQCNTYAATMRDTQINGLTTELKVTCLPNPALQEGDWVTVAAPVINNQIVPLVGKVKTMSLQTAGTSMQAMSLTVECSYADVQLAFGSVDRE